MNRKEEENRMSKIRMIKRNTKRRRLMKRRSSTSMTCRSKRRSTVVTVNSASSAVAFPFRAHFTAASGEGGNNDGMME